MKLTVRRTLGLVAFCALLLPAGYAHAQGVTTGSITGVVTDAQKAPVPGASVVAVHEPSGTRYEATTRPDGRFSLPGMRVGGPYTVTATLSGFQPQTVKDVIVSLGVATDLELALGQAAVTEEVTVTAQTSRIFSSARTGAATAVSRDILQNAPHRPRPDQRLRPPEPPVQRTGRRFLRRAGQPAQQHHRRRVLLQQLVRPRRRRPATEPASRRSRWRRSRRSRSTSRPTTCARATSSAPASTPSPAAAPTRSTARPTTGGATTRHGGHGGQGNVVQPRHVRLHERGLGVRPDPQEQALLLRQLRERQVHGAGHHVPRQHRRGDGGRQRHARPRLRPRPAELLPEVELRLRHRRLPGLPRSRPRPSATWRSSTTTSTTGTR